MEVNFLQALSCTAGLVMQGHAWPDGIQLAESAGPSFDPPRTAADTEGIRKAREEVAVRLGRHWKLTHDDRSPVRIVAVFVGRIEAKRDYRVRRYPDGTTDANGFGHMGAMPAQLWYHSIRRVEIVSRGK